MTYPSVLFGLLLAILYGAVFHLWRGGGFGKLLLYFVLAIAGFWAGHFLAAYLEWSFDTLGPLHLGTASAGSFLFLFIGHWLSLVEVERH
jgi:hypothetical protein